MISQSRDFWKILRLGLLLCASATGQQLLNSPQSGFCGQGLPTYESWGHYDQDYDNANYEGRGRNRMCGIQNFRWNFGFCNNIHNCICGRNKPDDPIRGDEALPYCQFLIQDNADSWMYPFRGQHPNPATWVNLPDRGARRQLDYSCGSIHYCLAFLSRRPVDTGFDDFTSQLFKFATYDGSFVYEKTPTTQWYKNLRSDLTNRLRFTDATIVQEGISFCIAGRHFKRSALVNMESMRGFLPLAERSFDIGNHIHPEDSTRMNRFHLDGRHKEYFARLLSGGHFFVPISQAAQGSRPAAKSWNKNSIPQHEYENVFAGFIPITVGNTINPNPPLELARDFIYRPAHPDYQPGPNCRNPYKVQVTTIEADGKPLHNYLHIKVYSENVGNPPNDNCPTGRIKLLMLEVRDEHGYPVGQFTDEIPCDKDEATLTAELTCPEATECRRWTGTKDNQMPCMFSHPKSTVHPSILMVSAPDMLNGAGGGGGNVGQGQPGGGNQGQAAAGGGDSFCRDSTKPTRGKVAYPVNEEYFTEVHATWKYAQMNNGWVEELHFATMIIEDETPIQYYTSRKTGWAGPHVMCDHFCLAYKRNPAEYAQDPFINNKEICIRNCRCDRGDSVNGGFRLVNYPDPGQYYDYNTACWFWHPFYTDWSRPGVYELALINRCVNENDNTNRPYGYTAQYTVLRPTFKTMGGWDNLQSRFIATDVVNCHKDLISGDLYEFDTAQAGRLTLRPGLKDFLDKEYTLTEPKPGVKSRYPLKDGTHYKVSPATLKGERRIYKLRDTPPPKDKKWRGNHWERVWCDKDGQFANVGPAYDEFNKYIFELPDWHTPGLSKTNSPDPLKQFLKFQYFGRTPQIAARKMFRSAHQDPIIVKSEFPDYPVTEYFGSEHLICSTCNPEPEAIVLQGIFDVEEQQHSLEELAEKSRCPCPFIPTTPPPELQTKTDVEIDGRQLHVINMLFAWMVLVPMAFFCARFYKETFSKVFFFQEFWWYTIHVLTLLTALLFTFGGIYGMKLKRDDSYVLVWTDATAVHIYSAYVLIGLFVVHLCLGPFRLYNPEWRMIQIALHWGIGWVEYCLAIVVTLSATAIPSGMMNCYAFGIYCGFILFQIVMTLGMELHMRLVVDRELQLDPPREYLPPPMMRVFHRDAPHSKCRMFALLVFVLGCVAFYGAMHTVLSLKEGEVGCFQPVAAKSTNGSRI